MDNFTFTIFSECHSYCVHELPTINSFCCKSIITRFVSRLTWQASLVEQELLTLPEHLSSLPVFNGICVTRSLVLYVCFVDRCLSSCTFSFGHCVVCSSSIHGFWLPLWYLQTLHIIRGLIVHQRSYRPSDSNNNLEI